MSIVTTPEAVPSRLFSIYQTLFKSEGGESRDKMEAWAAPPSLKSGGDEEEGGSPTTLFSNSLNEAKRIGLVEDVEGLLRLSDEARGDRNEKVDAQSRFRRYLMRTLFDPARAEETGQAAFMTALCWFLSNNPLRPLSFSDGPQQKLQADLGEAWRTPEINTVHRYQSFVYWARFLGFGVTLGAGDGARNRQVIPDPMRAIDDALPMIFANERSLSADAFLTRLSAIYPVFEGGSARVAYTALLSTPPDDEGGQRLSIATSLALRRLANRQRLKLDAVADAPSRLLNLGAGLERVSHVELQIKA